MNRLFKNISGLFAGYLNISDIIHISSVLIMIIILIKFNN